MADCSAIGSAIDRAATTTIEQNVTSSASQLVGSLWNSKSGVAVAQSQHHQHASALAMPVRPPTQFPNAMVPIAAMQQQQQQQQGVGNMHGLDAAWNSSYTAVNSTMNSNNNIRTTMPTTAVHNNSQAWMMQQQQQQQQQQRMQMQQQQQMQMNMMYQQNQRMFQQQQAMQQQQKEGLATNTEERLGSAWKDAQQQEESTEWHDNLDEEYVAEMKRLREEVGSYEDTIAAEGVTIEELAEAWSQANLDSDEMNQHQQPRPYEFHSNLEAYYDQNTTTESSKNTLESNATDFMSLGMEQFDKGEVHDAILSFQSSIRYTNPQSAQAWYMLGQCHAELDDDRNAILSLEHSIEHDPYSLPSLLALTASYVNELDYTKALHTLENFVTHSPKYAGMNIIDTNTSTSLQEPIERLLLQAHEWDSTDVDVLQALGVCYNINRNYSKAVSYFRQALELQQNTDTTSTKKLYPLWNKLGATLANSNQSTEALEAYHNALSIKPKYTRAWLNMAIAYSNLKNYTEASRCYLQTLSLNPTAEHCWNYLRISLSCLERWDLVELCMNRDLDGFHKDFDFV